MLCPVTSGTARWGRRRAETTGQGELPPVGGRLLSSGNESGTAPEDRPFRPDVEGLRAVAVLLVVLYHAGLTGLSGGYVGVDVFFVISGFVITGVLLRERISSGRTSVLAFYARRWRRILPAATVVVIATVAVAYVLLGVVDGDRAANDGRWAAVFLANFHLAASGTNYLTAQQPPSPLQHFWSLAVEEQFYIVYPVLFVLLASAKSVLTLRWRLVMGLGAVICGSFVFSVIQTSSDPTVAYFSPFTRAWELALGALLAIAARWLLNMPASTAAAMSWAGLAMIVISAVAFDTHSAYPGSLVAVPVVGAAFVIAGGTAAPPLGAEALLGLSPMRGLGRLSYSLYLWHWPILMLAAQRLGKTSLPLRQNVPWLLVALFLSMATYRFVENPIRHARFLLRIRWRSMGLGVALMSVTVGAITVESELHSTQSAVAAVLRLPEPDYQALRSLILAAPSIKSVPAGIAPSLADASYDWSGFYEGNCFVTSIDQSTAPPCVFGDPSARRTVVVYGDSHAAMWVRALADIGQVAHWRVIALTKAACPVDVLHYSYQGREWGACDAWHRYANQRLRDLHPNMVIVSQMYRVTDPLHYTPLQWQHGLARVLRSLARPKTTEFVLGDPPLGVGGPACLGWHLNDVQACSTSPHSELSPYESAEEKAAREVGARYVDVTPWFCSSLCTSVIGDFGPYLDTPTWHVSMTYSRLLEGVLAKALEVPGALR